MLPLLLFASSIFPLYYSIGGAPIYYLSAIWLAISLFTTAAKLALIKSRTIGLKSNIDKFVFIYIVWIFISFLLGTAFHINQETHTTFNARFVSLAWSFIIISPYFIGRLTHIPDAKLLTILSKFNLIFLATTISLILFFIFSGDLYLARQITEQRMPLIIVFWSWTFGAIAIYLKKYFFISWALGTAVVLLSLTRAAYVAWFAVIFFLIPLLPIKKIATLFVTVIGFLAFMLLITLSQDGTIAEQITSRFEEYFFSKDVIEKDYSANIRIEVWKGLLETLTQHPTAFFFGFGQLGPSYFPIDIIDPLGNVIPSTSAHSQFIDSIFRTGVIGLFIELLIFYQVTWRAARDLRMGIILRAASAALGAALVYGVFHETLRWPVFGILFWYLSGCISRKLTEVRNE
ncbi:O-antigen ligase family protein [Pseudothauera rhizosphaerae]|uniref:O-antigen ligase family protein n=1 Tax=Pseudothauera rhizosphaerae TaxID=2565932 RepID=A0A4S4AEQ1_9RHOO|nr:O-antigen ligase family protein [Pseudothauera rhizosphaerae]THF57628.1 O-antigen ligase family protein [Pseudothauera rhizosphaerae]